MFFILLAISSDLKAALGRIFELEALNEIVQRENDELKRNVDNKYRILEEQLLTADQLNADLKSQLNESRLR